MYDILETCERRRLSIAIPADRHEILCRHLLARNGEEDLAFALYSPSSGDTRFSALIHSVVLPEPGDRQQHGNVSFNLQYYERVLDLAVRSGSGIAFLHSHIGPGWQDMSNDDVIAETRLAGSANSVTGFPLFGLTLGTDEEWSGRGWLHESDGAFTRIWCESVRVVGDRINISFDSRQCAEPQFREMFRRTRTLFGETGHQHLARARVGIVGLGSVGMAVTEILARIGVETVTLIDFDEAQPHNLDRLQGTNNELAINQPKVVLAEALFRRSATDGSPILKSVVASVVESAGYLAALDCDVLFSCVDRPRARQVVNHIAFAHLIPVIDGGIAVRFRDGDFVGAEWQVQTASPGNICLECLGAFSSSDADTERAGMLDDPTYMTGLPADHHFKMNENVYPISVNLASLEVFHFMGLVGKLPQLDSRRIQRFYLVPGLMESDETRKCENSCDIDEITARGDTLFSLIGIDRAAEAARLRQQGSRAQSSSQPSCKNGNGSGFFHRIRRVIRELFE